MRTFAYSMSTQAFPIGVFDSGYGGLTVLKEFVHTLPGYDFIYLGDNARAPYGSRSFDTVHEYTWECVQKLFDMGCRLVILACNTASAKALRTIQQNDLPKYDSARRVLGVIRPTSEIIGNFTQTRSVGIFATAGTVQSESYPLEIHKFFPDIQVYQEACPMWVPLIENDEYDKTGADYFVQKHIHNLMRASGDIDTIVLGCTHYPLLMEKIKRYLPKHIQIFSQGEIVALSLKTYLEKHTEINARCSRKGEITFYTTDSTELFDKHATHFFGRDVESRPLHI
ncbi:MAG: glutamate racemase [Chitinophagales bacterium]